MSLSFVIDTYNVPFAEHSILTPAAAFTVTYSPFLKPDAVLQDDAADDYTSPAKLYYIKLSTGRINCLLVIAYCSCHHSTLSLGTSQSGYAV